MKKIAMVLLFAFTLCSIVPVYAIAEDDAEPVVVVEPELLDNGNGLLKRGVLVKIEFAQSLSSQINRQGEEVNYRVVEDVKVDGKVLIKKGATASGEIMEASAAKGWGKSGKLEVSVDKVIAVDGTEVKLATSFEDTKKWAGVKTVVGVAMLGFAFGGGMKGKKVNINEGHQIEVFIGEDAEINLSGVVEGSSKGTDCLASCGEKSGPEFSECMDVCKTCEKDTCKNMSGDSLGVCLSKCVGN